MNENEEYSDPADGVELGDLLIHRAFARSTEVTISRPLWCACCVTRSRGDIEAREENGAYPTQHPNVKAAKPAF